MAPARRRSLSVAMSDVDPITLALQPPPNETPAERIARMNEEARAKAVSDGIDRQLRIERDEIMKRKKAGDVKVLLLGEQLSASRSLCGPCS